jgi:hypothetical protein
MLASAAILSAPGALASSPLKITNCNSAVSRPKQIVLTCADANTVLKGLRWSAFGGQTAQATGTLVTNSCEPNCAAGKALSFPVTVTASDPRTCKKGLRVYNRLALRFSGHVSKKEGSLTRWTLGCPYAPSPATVRG